MNWLAHLYLARHDDAAMLGALLGDFVFGRSGLERFGVVEAREILVHRRVDGFTDTHPAVTALRTRFPDGLRRYAGIALDVYFDHLLARDWPCWVAGDAVPPTLDAFNARAYRILEARFDQLPPRLQAIAPAMVSRDWLGGYRERENVDRAVVRIAQRLSRNGERLVACLEVLQAIEGDVQHAFDDLLPALVSCARETRASLST